MRSPPQPIESLRTAIDLLPAQTRIAMLEGVRRNTIIVGAYTDRRGGVCPMLAAHRCGGRTDFLSFARSWDRFTRAKGRPRKASERELRVLTAHLEASLLSEDTMAGDSGEFAEVIRQHRELMARSGKDRAPLAEPERESERPGDPDRAGELRRRSGWAWLRPFRRYDDFSDALERAESERDELLEKVGANGGNGHGNGAKGDANGANGHATGADGHRHERAGV
jgi:hypothetical protein